MCHLDGKWGGLWSLPVERLRKQAFVRPFPLADGWAWPKDRMMRSIALPRHLIDVLLASTSAGLFVLCFPPYDWSLLGWCSLAPLLLSLDGAGPLRAFALTFLFGWVSFTGIFSWLWHVGAFNAVDYALLATFFGLHGGVFGLGYAWLSHRMPVARLFIVPSLWVSLEYIRAHLGFLSAPGMLLGHSQYQHTTMIQIVSMTGVAGLSFVMMLTSSALSECMAFARHRWRRDARAGRSWQVPAIAVLAAGLAVAATWGYGMAVLREPQFGETLKVAIVQGHVSQASKWDDGELHEIVNRYVALTERPGRDRADLIVWPETAVPADILAKPFLNEAIRRVAQDTGAYLLLGSSATAKSSKTIIHGKYFNSMFLVTPKGEIQDEYRKMLLVPFGEFDPFQHRFHWPKAIVASMGTVAPGDRYTQFHIGGIPFGTVVCWESLFPDHVRQFVVGGARFIVNTADEGWFAEPGASAQFLAVTIFRSVEHRLAMARSVNYGISAFIDPFGRIVRTLGGEDGRTLADEGVLTGELVLSDAPTFYTSYGELFALSQVGFCALWWGVSSLNGCWGLWQGGHANRKRDSYV